ncbi:hypothetical protein B0H17DRAFT_1128399 [Mycena rosella]|uniref:Uncharacterized protein n=1 Tax=Mycena rosella TaxID=1033263 RepID=A0AAD7DYQ8_MYCRO|nr:hypothetical protein B0H17DRAFT_1128399 [Mycena rosella]
MRINPASTRVNPIIPPLNKLPEPDLRDELPMRLLGGKVGYFLQFETFCVPNETFHSLEIGNSTVELAVEDNLLVELRAPEKQTFDPILGIRMNNCDSVDGTRVLGPRIYHSDRIQEIQMNPTCSDTDRQVAISDDQTAIVGDIPSHWNHGDYDESDSEPQSSQCAQDYKGSLTENYDVDMAEATSRVIQRRKPAISKRGPRDSCKFN